MAKIVLIGAGSHTFSKNLITDIVSLPDLRDSTISLMDINKKSLDLPLAFARKLVEQNGLKTKIEATTDRRKALDGANYVITTIQAVDRHLLQDIKDIATKYGVNQAIGDTIGPSGVFYALHHIPALLDIAHDMEKICPDAWLLNYANPMAMNTWAITDYSHVKNVGMCHSVQHTSAELARYLGVPYEELSYWVAGINHMAWFLELKWRGKDAYPLLREKFKNAELYSKPDAHWAGPDNVRVEVFRAVGYFITESSQHLSEYLPYFRKRPELIKEFRLTGAGGRFDRSTGSMQDMRAEEDKKWLEQINSNYKFPVTHSGEYCTVIMNSLETGKPARVNVNLKNTGLITNLPEGCCVEVPCLVDNRGIHPCYVGDLPPQCAALNRTNINVQELAVRGIIEKDKTKIFQAILVDPLTSAMLTIDETRKMVDEMFLTEEKYSQKATK